MIIWGTKYKVIPVGEMGIMQFSTKTVSSWGVVKYEWGSPSTSDPRAKNTGQRATKGTALTSQSLSPWCDCRRLGSTWASWRWQDINVGNPL